MAPAVTGDRAALRFIGAFFATVALGLGVVWTAAATLRDGFMPGEYAMLQTKQRLIGACALPGTVILGDSRAVAGFIPAEIPGTINLAMGGMSPVELYYTARHLLACPQAPRRIILSLSIPQFLSADYYWVRSAPFGILTFGEMEDVRRRSRALGDDSLYGAAKVGDVDAILSDWLYAHDFPPFVAGAMWHAHLLGRLRSNRALSEATIQSGGQHLYGTDAGSDGVSIDGLHDRFQVSPLIDQSMRRMLALLAARGTQVLFMAAPMNRATGATVSAALREEFDAYLAGLAGEYRNFRIVGDPLPVWDDKWFGDTTHMNQAGAEVFSAHIAASLAGLDKAPAGGE